jgi:DNA sulfur modification protein DndD
MAMQLRVTGWRYENIRGGIRDVVIDLRDDPRWTLIQMPNGTGKTTTMTLLRTALTGVELTPAEIADMRADDGAEEGLFELRLDIDGKPHRIQVILDFVGRTCGFNTIRAQEQSGGSEPGLHLPLALKRLLSPEFVKLFVFDGEFAKDIRAVGKDRTTTSIRTLYRLDQLDRLRKDITKLVADEQARASEVSNASKQQGLTRLSNSRDEAVALLKGLQKKQRAHVREEGEKRTRLEEVSRAIAVRNAQDERYRKRRAELDGELGEHESSIRELTTAALSAMRTPTKVSPALLTRLRTLGDRLTTLQLPKTISSEFFHELARSKFCVCDTPIGEKEKTAIIAGASRYLAEDQITVINRMKKTVRESDATGSEFGESAAELRKRLRLLRGVQQSLDSLQQEQVAGGDTELDALLKEQAELKRRLEELARDMEMLGTSDRTRQATLQASWKTNIGLCRAEVKVREGKLATATNTFNFVNAAQRVTGLVDKVAEDALERLRESVRVATNEKLERLAASEPLRVARIGTALELSSEGHSAKGGVSEGQSLSIAYAFLTSLLSQAPYKLPFIVDSPAVSLDVQVRREVGEIIPELFDQMIMFVISSERDGFADAFYARQDVRFITIWRDGATGSRMEEGLDAFRAFHSAEVVDAGGRER